MQKSDVIFFTVCNRRDAAHAACLRESIATHHPGSEFTVWLLDEGPIPVEAGNLPTRSVRECLDEPIVVLLSSRYSFGHYASAVKPRIFQEHFAEGARRVICLDSDIYLFGPLTEVIGCLDGESTGVLFPRTLSPEPRDNRLPTDRDILREGIFSLGAMAYEQAVPTAEFLKWWWEWVLSDCISSRIDGVFADPHFLALGLAFWDSFRVLKDPGYNVSFWNLHERKLARSQTGEWLVDHESLAFFQFSGFPYANRWRLSNHESRAEVEKGSPLAQLLEFYSERLATHGVSKAKMIVPCKLTFADGGRFDSVALALLCDLTREKRSFKTICGLGPESFREYLRQIPLGQIFSNYESKLFEIRPDLVAPLSKASRSEIRRWVTVSGVPELSLDPVLLEAPTLATEPRGVTFVGYIQSEKGLGQAARGHIAALRRVGIEPRLLDVTWITDPRMEVPVYGPLGCSVTIIELNPDQLPRVLSALDLARTSPNTYRIGIWAWETQEFPDHWIPQFADLDEVWCGSRFVADAISRKSPVPVICIPYCVEVPAVQSGKEAFELDSQEFVFLFTFDFDSYPERKNPYDLLASFRQAFSPEEPVRLVVKSINSHKRPEEAAKMMRSARGLKVTFIDDVLDETARYRLLASCDAYVSLHRAEGFGYGMAEAMAYGKPVVATGWSGNMDFMTAWNSYPVDYSLEVLEDDAGIYPEGTLWARPNLDDASRNMRLVWEDSDLRAQKGTRAKQDIAEGFGPDAVGLKMKDRLHVIAQSKPGRNKPDPPGRAVIPRMLRRLRAIRKIV